MTASDPLKQVLRYRRPFIIAFHLLIAMVASYAALWLRFDGAIPPVAHAAWLAILPAVLVARGLAFGVFRLYQGLWRYTSTYDLRNIVIAVVSSSAVIYPTVRWGFGVEAYPRSAYIIDALLLILLLGGVRMVRRFAADFSHTRGGRRVVIFGAGDAGEMILRDMRNKERYGYDPVGFIDDDETKVGRRIHGVRVLGTRGDLREVLDRVKPDELLIAMPSAPPRAVREIVRALEPYKIPIKTLPNLRDIIDCRVDVGQIRNLAVEDLLARAPVGLDAAPLKRLIVGRRVMVTGAGGSIGSELCRQIAALEPESLVLLERYENTLHELRLELGDRGLGGAVHPLVGDVTDAARMSEVIERYKPQIVFHAAAHKHVPLMEENPCEAIKNNVRGTRVLAEAAEAHGVERFILISTDKAVNPTSTMGASKRVAELVLQAYARDCRTSFSVVRFGNVLGSNGSVIPRFLDQIRRGGPVTITHPDMRRFFMLIPEAVQLVLHAAAHAREGAVYVLEMGDQVKLVDMARHLIRLAGKVPDQEIAIEFIGLRPGEKLFEELVGAGEEARPSGVEKILCVRGTHPPRADLADAVRTLEQFAAEGKADAVRRQLHVILADYAAPAAQAAEVSAPGVEHRDSVHGLSCPSCHGAVHRSRTRRLSERIRKRFTESRLFRCDHCGWRGWRMPLPEAHVPPRSHRSVAPLVNSKPARH